MKIADELVEPLAIAICFGGFSTPGYPKCTPHEYWERVAPGPRAHYRDAARELLRHVLAGSRLMVELPYTETIDSFMKDARITTRHRARQYYACFFKALPTIWQFYAQGIEARQGEDPSSGLHPKDESPVGKADAP